MLLILNVTAMDQALEILVVEDESIISEVVKMMLEDMGHHVLAVAHNKTKAQEAIDAGGFNFAVLDINLEGGMEGIEMAEQLRQKRVPFMFLTSYADKYTLSEAKKTVPGAYVLKPFTEEELYTGIEMSLLHSGRAEEQTVNIKDGHRSQLLDPEDILYLKADNIYVEIYTSDRKIVSRQTLGAVMEKFPPHLFIRVHRSYIVNRKKIDILGSNSLQIGSITIPISRSHRAEVHRILSGE